MIVCCIWMDEMYMVQVNGSWDFMLYDVAFDVVEWYGVWVFVIFFLVNIGMGVGGFKFFKDVVYLVFIESYIGVVVFYFSKYLVFFVWVLQNEFGVGGIMLKGGYME